MKNSASYNHTDEKMLTAAEALLALSGIWELTPGSALAPARTPARAPVRTPAAPLLEEFRRKRLSRKYYTSESSNQETPAPGDNINTDRGDNRPRPSCRHRRESIDEDCEIVHGKKQHNQHLNDLSSNEVCNRRNSTPRSEWVNIGTGETVIHRSKFDKIKWHNYLAATRGLLVAIFGRRELAARSGKKSPAHQNKAAKQCLDGTKVKDVIEEACVKFNVTESMVRAVITTKCADECKMRRMRALTGRGNRNQHEEQHPADEVQPQQEDTSENVDPVEG